MMLGAFYSKLNVENISGGRNDLKWRWRERGKRANSLGNSEQVGPYRHQLWEDNISTCMYPYPTDVLYSHKPETILISNHIWGFTWVTFFMLLPWDSHQTMSRISV